MPQRGWLEVLDLDRPDKRDVSISRDWLVHNVVPLPDGTFVLGIMDIGYRLVRRSKTGEDTVLWADPEEWIAKVIVAPDGRSVALRTQQTAGDVWMLEPSP